MAEQTETFFLNVLKDITAKCEACEEFRFKLFRFKIAIPPDKLLINHELIMDLVFLDGQPVLHVIDTHKNFQAGVFVTDKTPDGV